MPSPPDNSNPNKIRGGKWTVFLFFWVSVAYSLGWMTFSSLLGYFSSLYGAQILLYMNIAYFLPSIPLLTVSSIFDEALEAKFGVCKNLLFRLVGGLVGCMLVCAVFPFYPSTASLRGDRALLLFILALGLLQAIAFSASYQMVARFANKNVVSLGLGCVGSGLVTFLLEVVLLIGAQPSRLQLRLLFLLTAGIILLGLLAAISLLSRHWAAIEAWSSGPSVLKGRDSMLMGTSSGLTTMQSRVIRRASAPQLLNVVNPLDYHVLEESAFTYRELADGMYGSLSEDQLLLRQQLPPDRREPSSGGRPSERSPVPEHIAIDNLQSPAPQEGRRRMYPGTAAVKEPADDEQPEVSQVPLPAVSPFATAREPGTSSPEASVHRGRLQSTPEHPDDSAVSNSKTNLAVLTAIWPTVVALFLSGVFFTTVFPFFTYIPTSGRFGLLLPKVLFFVRLFCDVVGRMLPRFKPLSTSSPKVVLALGLVMTASLGFFFAYFQFPKQRLSDIGIAGDLDLTENVRDAVYIGGTWVLGGYINTMCYTLAPQSVHAEHRAVANAYLAITFQTSHVFGLIFATFLIFLMFDASRAPSTIPN